MIRNPAWVSFVVSPQDVQYVKLGKAVWDQIYFQARLFNGRASYKLNLTCLLTVNCLLVSTFMDNIALKLQLYNESEYRLTNDKFVVKRV